MPLTLYGHPFSSLKLGDIKLTRTWKDAYKRVRDIGSGGQADSIVAVPIRGGKEVFLKILRHQNDSLRRSRMHREVEAYRTLRHPRIPVLLDSNTHEFSNLEFKLFLVSELIAGPTLTEYVSKNGPMGLLPAIALVSALLETIEYCHANQVVHRDIKPDNILLRGSSSDDPVLVDFGLSFDDSFNQQGTEHGEELGNRFLRLPELAGGSPNKRDPRSDLTFVAGILIYCLSGEFPSILSDHAGLLPHQRTGIRPKLREGVTPPQRIPLERFFDRAFQTSLDLRWQSASEMREALDRISSSEYLGDSSDLMASRVKAALDSPLARNAETVRRKLKRGLELIGFGMNDVKKEIGRLSTNQTGRSIDSNSAVAKDSLALSPEAVSPEHFIHFVVEIVGDEIVLSASYRDRSFAGFGRVACAEPLYSDDLQAELRKIFLFQLNDLVHSGDEDST